MAQVLNLVYPLEAVFMKKMIRVLTICLLLCLTLCELVAVAANFCKNAKDLLFYSFGTTIKCVQSEGL